MPIGITAAYAAVLALIIVALGINVTVHRVKLAVPLGDRGNPQMLRMMRVHGNAAEYIPIAVLLMLIYEIGGGAHIVLHIAGIALVIARLLQTADMWTRDKAGPGRIIGQSVTWLTTAGLAVAILTKTV